MRSSIRVRFLSHLTTLQRLAVAALAVTTLSLFPAGFWPDSGARTVFNVSLLAFFAFVGLAILAPLGRRLIWRVRNRLLVTYFLAGVLPVVLIASMVLLTSYIFLGATISYLCKSELDRQLTALELSARRQAQAIAEGKSSSLAEDDRAHIIVRRRDRTEEAEGPIQSIPTWSEPGLKEIVITSAPAYYMVAHGVSSEGADPVEVFAYRPFDDRQLASLIPGLAWAVLLDATTSSNDIEVGAPILDSSRVARPGRPQSLWDAGAIGTVPLNIRKIDSGESDAYFISLLTKPNVIIGEMFGGLGVVGPIVSGVLLTLAVSFLVVELAAVLSTAALTRTLTRAVHDLYIGTKKVESGDFSHRIPIRTKDQLSALASSFNSMTQRVERLIAEVREKEKLESELEIARHVQRQLFPKEIPVLKTLELIGLCHPATAVSGDYYDFIPFGSNSTAIVIGDISGKGISAALLMASIQSSLHAQLAFQNNGTASLATLVGRLNQQLYENTPPEKYATFFCGIYNDETSQFAYANAGHLPPILIRDRQPIRLEANGTIVGMFPDCVYEQTSIQLEPGDLLAAFTDGVTEAESESGEQFGEDRVIALLQQYCERPLEQIAVILTDSVRTWAHDIANRDDTTLLLARRLPVTYPERQL